MAHMLCLQCSQSRFMKIRRVASVAREDRQSARSGCSGRIRRQTCQCSKDNICLLEAIKHFYGKASLLSKSRVCKVALLFAASYWQVLSDEGRRWDRQGCRARCLPNRCARIEYPIIDYNKVAKAGVLPGRSQERSHVLPVLRFKGHQVFRCGLSEDADQSHRQGPRVLSS